MTLLWETYDPDPASNTQPPPLGAPENATKLKSTNEIDRRMMAAISEIGTWVKDRFNTLGTMADQNAATVAITGGTVGNVDLQGSRIATTNIDNTNAIDGGAITYGKISSTVLPAVSGDASSFGGMTPQQWYDFQRPLGSCLFTFHKTASIATPPGVTATWTVFNVTDFIKVFPYASYSGDWTSPMTGGTGSNSTTAAGFHDHGGKTGFWSLTAAQLPAHHHTVPAGGSSGATKASGYAVGALIQNSEPQQTGDTGTGAGHNHDIPGAPDHTHGVSLDPPWIGVLMWVRTA